MGTLSYDLYAIPPNEMVKHLKSFEVKSEAVIAFNLLVNDGKMRAVFLDEKENFTLTTHSVKNIKKWRKRANKTKGQIR
jgi:hypothetical protein